MVSFIVKQGYVNFLFSCKSHDCLSWKALTDLLNTLHSESYFKISSTGINFNLVDGTGSQALEAEWKKENFENYNCDQDIKIGMDLQMLTQVMGRARKGDDITFSLSEAGANVQISSGKMYTLQLPSVGDLKERGTIKSEVKCEFEITMNQLKEIVADVQFIDDFMKILCKNDIAIFSTDSKVHTGSTTIQIPHNDTLIESSFSLMFLTAIISALAKNVDKIQLGFIPNGPLRIRCNIEPLGEIRYYLAPKMKKEDEV